MPSATGYNFGAPTRTKYTNPREKRQRNEEDSRKLFIGQLPRDLDSAGMKAIFEGKAEIEDGYVIRDPKTTKSRGYGFIKFADETAVDQIMAARPYSLGEKEIVVKRVLNAERPENMVTSERLFVGGLKDGHTEEALRDYFSQFGDIESVEIAKDKEGNARKFATVTYSDYDSVDKAIAARKHTINDAPVGVRKFLNREEMNKVEQIKAERHQFDPFGPMGPAAMMGMGFGSHHHGMMGGGGAGDWGYGSYADMIPGAGQGGRGGNKRMAIGQYQQDPMGYGYGDMGGHRGGGGGGGGGQQSPEAAKFAGALRQHDVSDAGIESLMRENLLNPQVLAALTMSEFGSLPLSMGDRKRVQLVLSNMQ